MSGDGAQQDGVNVQVLLRCRPVSEREIVDRTPQVISCNEALREVTLYQNGAGSKQFSKTFRFDRVFGTDSAQDKLFKQAISPIVQEVMDGFNCTVFAYGQTGTGKTYTMEGGPRESTDGRNLSAEAGVIPRSIKQIFDMIEDNNMDSTVKVSFLELYNEELTDLLTFEDDKEASKKLRLLEDRSGVVVQGLEEVIVRSATEIYQVLDRGTAKRRTAATWLNNRSSRSHSIFTITIHLKDATPEGEDVIKIGKLNLVDLAGSENISRSGAKDSRAREAGSINQSLLTLGRVITALVEHSGHIPYRDSKLTRLLRDSLGGRTKTCIIATIAPTVQCLEETISTLDYAHRAKNIRNKPELNQKISKTTMIKDLASEIERLRLDLSATREKNGVYLSNERYEQGEMERIQLRDTVKGLKAELELEEATHTQTLEQLKEAHDSEVDALQTELDCANQNLASTQDQLNQAQITIQERQFMILSHQRAEHALASHAQRVISELAACSQDLDGLFAKFAEVVEMQKGDRMVLHGLRQYVGSRMGQMGTFIADAVVIQQQCLSSLAASASALRAKKDSDVVQLCDQVTAGQAKLAALKDASMGSMAELTSCLSTSLAGAGDCSSAYSAKASASLQSVENEATAAVTALASALDGQAACMQDFGAKQASGLQLAMKALQTLAAAAQGNLAETSSSLVQLQRSVGSKQQHTDKVIADAAAMLESSIQSQQDALMKQIGSMVQTFAVDRASEMKSALQEMRQQLARNAEAISSEATSIHDTVVLSASKLKDAETGMAESVQASGQGLHQMSSEIGGVLKQLASQGSSYVPSLETKFKQQSELLSSYSKELSSRLGLGLSSAKAVAESAHSKAEQAAASVSELLLCLHQGAQSQNAADVEILGGMQQAASEAGQKLTVFSGSCAQGTVETSKCVEHEVGQQLAHVVQLSGVPAKRSLDLPPVESVHELLCPPEDVVLQQYRREKALLLKSGGDVKMESLLMSPQPDIMRHHAAAITVRRPRSPVQQHDDENQMAMDEEVMDVVGAKQASPSKPRSKIPGLAFQQGLVDRTNMA